MRKLVPDFYIHSVQLVYVQWEKHKWVEKKIQVYLRQHDTQCTFNDNEHAEL